MAQHEAAPSIVVVTLFGIAFVLDFATESFYAERGLRGSHGDRLLDSFARPR